jgi:hypothetical protein
LGDVRELSAAGVLPDFYRTLQVDPCAHPLVIKAAYRTLIRTAHPDVGGDVRVAQSLTRAYSILSDRESRSSYDRMRDSRTSLKTPAREPRDPVAETVGGLKSRLNPLLAPLGQLSLTRSFDVAGRLRGDGNHRIWVRALRDWDPTRKSAFQTLAEAGRLTRSVWEWGSDLFVALVPRWCSELGDLLEGPLGPWPRLGSAILVLDTQRGQIHYEGRTNELPTYAVVAQAFRDVMLTFRKRTT